MLRRSNEFRDKNDALKFLNDPKNNIMFVRLIFPDILGRLREFCVPVSEISDVINYGKSFEGGSVDGLIRMMDSDLRIKPDPKSLKIIPWTYIGSDDNITWKEALIFGEIFTAEGEHYAGDTRHILKKILQKANETFNIDDFQIGLEPEFFILKSPIRPECVDKGNYYLGGKNGEIRKEIQIYLHEMGIRTESDYHGESCSQHVIKLKHANAKDMADNFMIYKYVVKKVARRFAYYATFMPKPFEDMGGSGLHVHQSLWSKNKNMIYDEKDRYKLSYLGKRYLAGILKYSKEISLITNNWLNSYKRIKGNSTAPAYAIWGRSNQSLYARIPDFAGRENAARIELRNPDSCTNPYLCFSAILSAGLQGVKDNLELETPFESDIEQLKDDEKENLDKSRLPKNLKIALDMARESNLLKYSIGLHAFKKMISAKEEELRKYEEKTGLDIDDEKQVAKITDFEIDEYLHWM
ncbi:MAG: glutamine synthetase family protein [Candidatus Woesearchaeota archaeon]